MGTYYFIRHGETKANETGILQGHLDVPLSEVGRKQAAILGEALKEVFFDAIYASDLSRAVDTAKAIAVHQGLSVVTDPRLREVHCGMLQGKPMAEWEVELPDVIKRLKEDPVDAPRPGGESYRDLYNRVEESFLEICRKHPDDTVAIVGHGGTLRALMACVKGVTVDPSEPSVANCSITIVEGNPSSWNVLKKNDVEHLTAAGQEDPRKKAEIYRW
jgi:probable phosphoglycerate mutase